MDGRAADLIGKLLTADVTRRLGCMRAGASDVKEHRWFARLDWDAVFACNVPPPFVPEIRSAGDTRYFPEDYPDSDGDTAEDLTPTQAQMFRELDSF